MRARKVSRPAAWRRTSHSSRSGRPSATWAIRYSSRSEPGSIWGLARGDHRVFCILYAREGRDVEGKMRGAGRGSRRRTDFQSVLECPQQEVAVSECPQPEDGLEIRPTP